MATTDPNDLALAEVQAYAGWHIAPTKTEDVTVDGSGSDLQMLPTLHLTAVNKLTVDGGVIDPDTVEWSESGYLRMRGSRGWVYGFPRGLRSVVANITHGYDQMPLDVQAVIDRLAARGNDAGTIVQVGAVRTATGPDGLPVGMTLTDLDKAVLDRYRLPPRP